MHSRFLRLLAAAGLALWLAPAAVGAHPLAPALLQVTARSEGSFEVLWRQPLLAARGVHPTVRLPERCRALGVPVVRDAARGVETTWTVDCGAGGLVDATLGVDGLVAPLSAVVRVVFEDGRSVDGLVTAGAPDFVVPGEPDRAAIVRSYVGLGLEHIATGMDHLLFVFGLVLLASTWRRIAATVTAFTVGHSVTLALAVFGWVRVPARPVELAIAISVLLVAIEVARHEDASAREMARPWTFAAGFGLLHGLGFASGLSGAGLRAGALALGLLAFNVGIELGQLAFVLVVIAVALPLRRLLPSLPAWILRVPVYAMGTVAAYWCFERAALMLGG